LVAGSIPAEPRTTDVLSEDFSIREMLEALIGPEGKRKLRLRHKTNDELFALYDSQLVLEHRSPVALAEARRFLGHYRALLGQYPPTPELAASFCIAAPGPKTRLEQVLSQLQRIITLNTWLHLKPCCNRLVPPPMKGTKR
jgi:hypothetical protein